MNNNDTESTELNLSKTFYVVTINITTNNGAQKVITPMTEDECRAYSHALTEAEAEMVGCAVMCNEKIVAQGKLSDYFNTKIILNHEK